MAGYDNKNYKWDSNSEFKARDKHEEEEDNQGRRKGHHHPEGPYCGPHEPSWNKRHLVLLYKDIAYNEFGATCQESIDLQNLSRNQTAIVETKVYTDNVTYPDSDDSCYRDQTKLLEAYLDRTPSHLKYPWTACILSCGLLKARNIFAWKQNCHRLLFLVCA